MKKDRLEEFVRAHKDEFDVHMPSQELWNEINRKLPGKDNKRRLYMRWSSIAAVMAVVIFGSGVVLHSVLSTQQEISVALETDSEVKELLEAEAYYAQQVNVKLQEIQKCYRLDPELQGEVEGDLLELEQMYNTLKQDLSENVSNKEVIEAMIENNRFRLKLVSDVLEQVNC